MLHITSKAKRVAYKTLHIFASLALLLNVSSFGLLAPAQAANAVTTAVCPTGDVKFDITTQSYEYTDGSGTVAGNGDQVAWQATAGYTITGVCVKAGTQLYNPSPSSSPYSKPGANGISHVVLYTEPSTVTNPPLGNACGLDITLVFDGSGSIDGTEYGQMQTAFNGFVDAFIPGTPTIMSVVEFATDAVLRQGFTGNATTLHNEINENRVQPGGQYTNWEDGLWRARQVLLNDANERPAKPDVVIFASDGNPNTIGIDGAGTNNNAGGETNAVNAAVVRANELKNDGVRIVALGIGNDLDVANLQKISGPVVANNAAEITVTSDVIKADFNTLASVLSELADELCGGKILVQKQIDANNDGIVDVDGSVQHPALVGWDFTVSNDAKTTTDTGSLEFSVLNGTYTVTETNMKSDMHLQSAVCKKDNQPIGTVNLANRTVSGLTMGTDETITCTFVNAADTYKLRVKKNVDLNGDGDVDDANEYHVTNWTWDIQNGAQNIATSDWRTLVAGSYTISEDQKPGFHVTDLSCDNGQSFGATESATVNLTQDVTCVFTNSVDTAKIYGYKFNDLNGNGTWDNGEPAKSGVTINLTGATNASDSTDANGYYEFPGLTPGNYTVSEVVPTDWIITTSNNVPVTLVAGQDQRVDFGNQATICKFTIEKEGPARVDVNGNITYTITYHNEGNGWCIGGGVKVTDVIPSNTTYVSHNSSPSMTSNFDGSKVVWNLGNVAPQATGILTLVVKANDKGADICGEWEINNVASFWAKDKVTEVVQTGESEHVYTTVAKECRGDLRIKKFNDLNGDGVKGDSEPYLTGWDFTVSQNGQTVYTGTTGDDGNYLIFEDIPVGTYQVTETQKDDWMNTTALTQDATIVHNQMETLYFGNFKKGFISGYKFEDKNSNGSWDNGEPGIPSWEIRLSNGAVAYTDSNGYYSFTNLIAGTYTVSEKNVSGWTQTAPASGTYSVEIVSGTISENNNFGNFKNVIIKGYKYQDMDGDGVKDAEDLPIQGWKLYLDGGQEALTDANGRATWTVTSAGTYTVSEETRDGWMNTTPTSVDVVVTSGMEHQVVKFLNFEKPSVQVTKKFDADGNLQTTGDQTVKQNWTVQLWKNGVQIGTDQLTDANGQYTWANLTPGTYTVKEIVPAGYLNLGDAEYTFSAISGYEHVYTFYNFKLGKISGYKFEDMNANGTWDQGEPALEGWKIILSNGSFLYTDEFGYYQFTGLEADTYSLSEDIQDGWVQMAAPSDVVVTSGTDSTDNNFGNTELSTITATKLIDADGSLDSNGDQTVKAGWTVQLWKNGAQFGSDQVTDANGQYTWTNLMPGTYTVKEVFDSNEFTPLTETEFLVEITSGDAESVTFINFENADLKVYKYMDTDGTLDTTDDWTATAGWMIEVWKDGQLVDTQLTNAQGYFLWENLAPGTYTVKEIFDAAEFLALTDTQYDVTVASGTLHEVTFGNFELGTISGYKFEDIDRSATWNGEETGLAGWTINLWNDANGQPGSIIASTITDQHGYYEFTGLTAGTYYLSENLTAGWVQTYPAAPGIHGPIVVTSGYDNNQQEAYFDFGNAEKITLDVDKYNDQEAAQGGDGLVAPNEVVNYTIDWSVSGNSIATNVVLVDHIPAELTIDSASISHGGVYDDSARTITWDFGTQNPYASGQVTYTAAVNLPLDNGTQIVNVARLSADNADPTFDEDDSTVTVTSAPILNIEKTVNIHNTRGFVNPTNTVTYTISVWNTGTEIAYQTMLSDLLPAGFTVAGTDLTTKEWSLGDLIPGDAPVVITFDATVGKDVARGFYDNLATTWADNHPSVSDIATVEVRIPTVLAEEADPVLQIVKTAHKNFINPGDSLTYTITVTNIGDAQAEAVAVNVRIQDVLPAGFTFEDGSVTKVFPIGDLLQGESKSVTYTAVSAKTVVPGDYENVAIAWADNHGQVSDFAVVEVRKPTVLGAEALPVTGGGMLLWLYSAGALIVLAFAGWALRLTLARDDN
ncbi:MAG: SdrD B-like domain-containing protein [Patescibacteria group bacterium]